MDVNIKCSNKCNGTLQLVFLLGIIAVTILTVICNVRFILAALKAACKCDDNELEKKANGDKKELKKLKELKRNAKEALWNLNEPKLTVKDTKGRNTQ